MKLKPLPRSRGPWRLEIKVKSTTTYKYFETKKAAKAALVKSVEKHLASLKSHSPDHLSVRPLGASKTNTFGSEVLAFDKISSSSDGSTQRFWDEASFIVSKGRILYGYQWS
jgi:hypothetical protein